MNYKAWYALGELVDNALDSYLINLEKLHDLEGQEYRLRVVIEIDSDEDGMIRVWDNAAGIHRSNYQRAFITAEPPADSAGLSQFGIGLKSASCWFARQWRVRTKALGETVERTIEFNVPRIIELNLEEIPTSSRRAPKNQHFTEVKLWNLYKPPQTQTLGKMKRHLAGMYRQFIRDGDLELSVNGDILSYTDPNVLIAPHFPDGEGKPVRWHKPISFRLRTGEEVTGFAAIREKGSTREAGFSLYRHRRLIVGSDDDTYRPQFIFGGTNSFRYQRLFGELHLDDFEVSHTKDGFLWEDKEDKFLAALKRKLDSGQLPLLEQADNYRARQAPNDIVAAADRAARATAEVLPKAEETIESQAVAEVVEEYPPARHPAGQVTRSHELSLTISAETWRVAIELTNDEAATEWLSIRDRATTSRKGVRSLGILVSLSHPFMQRFGGATADDVEGLVRLAVGLAVAETTAREAGAKLAPLIRRNLNELLSGALAEQ